MALQISVKHRNDPDLVCAVIRMDHKTHRALKEFMHCKDPVVIRFQHGVKLCYRGYGWYRLDVSNDHRALEKLEHAVKVIKRFWREEEQKTTEALKMFVPHMKDPDLRVSSFSNAHCEGEYGYMGIVRERPPVPVAAHKLNALVSKFQRAHK